MRIAKLLSALILVISAGMGQAIAQTASPPEESVYQNDILGVSLRFLPPGTRVVEDQYLSDAYGFTIVDSEGRTVLRVTWRHRDAPDQMEQRVQELIQGFPDLHLHSRPVLVGSYRGVMIPDAPGIDPSTYVYLIAHGRLYEVVCPQREGSVECKESLQLLSFFPAQRSPDELHLVRAEDALYEKPPAPDHLIQEGPTE